MNSGSVIARLLAGPVRAGRVDWIGLRTERRGAVVVVEAAVLDEAAGVVGDRYAGRTGTRQVSLIQAEHLVAIGAYLGEGAADPVRLRRNLVVSGVNLLALRDRTVRVGGAVLAVTGVCAPCSRMEEELGTGGYNAVRGHGGVVARVVQGGVVRVGNAVTRVEG